MNDTDDYGYDYAQFDHESRGSGFLMGALAGAALASTLVWLLDPQSGAERRARVRARASSAYRRGREGMSVARERARTLADEGRGRLREVRGAADRMRSEMRGAADRMSGDVEGGSRDAQSADTAQESGDSHGYLRSQGGRIATGAAGLGLAGWGLARRGPLGLALGALGVYLAATSARQRAGSRLGSGIEIDTGVTVNAPIERVWAHVRRVEAWPRFMTHVREIVPTGERRHHWRVDGPAGVEMQWDSEITEERPNERLAWCTLPGSSVDSEGSIDLENDGHGGTRLRLRMLYDPPAGAAGHAVAKLFGRDPVRQARDDLRNLKRAIEGGASTGGIDVGGSARASSPLGGTTTPSH